MNGEVVVSRSSSHIAHNPFFDGPHSDLLSLLPFGALCAVMYFVGTNKLLKARTS